MQEIEETEKLRLLQSERESFKSRTKTERTGEESGKPDRNFLSGCAAAACLSTTANGQNWSAGAAGSSLIDEFIDRGPEWRAFDHDQRIETGPYRCTDDPHHP